MADTIDIARLRALAKEYAAEAIEAQTFASHDASAKAKFAAAKAAVNAALTAVCTERDALRAELDAARADARWYCLNFQGLATLCTDKEEAEALAAQCDMTFPRGRPHRAALLGNVAAIDTAMKGTA